MPIYTVRVPVKALVEICIEAEFEKEAMDYAAEAAEEGYFGLVVEIDEDEEFIIDGDVEEEQYQTNRAQVVSQEEGD